MSVVSRSVAPRVELVLCQVVAAMVPLSVVVCALLAAAAATDVQQCPGRSIENLQSSVQLDPCKRLPCRLKKGTNEFVTIKFKTENEIKELTNHVTADVFGVPLPFIGVDGASVCDKLQTESGEKAACPLPAGTYIYKDSFAVLSFYPSIPVRVHWALQSAGEDIACFQVAAKIVG